MGHYTYMTKPSAVALAIVREPDGTEHQAEIALYTYAYKPYGFDYRANQRMHFRSGAQACESAWKRTGKTVPPLGVGTYEGEVFLDSQPFLTRGDPIEWNDDASKPAPERLVRWVKLPKGFRLEQPKPAYEFGTPIAAEPDEYHTHGADRRDGIG